jgi:hypothetical protein
LPIEWITGDAFSYHADQGVDIVISSLFTHHLPQPEIVRFLGWMESVAEVGWFLNDLERTRWTFHAFQALASTFRWHRFVRHDGPVSIRRSFLEADWQRLTASAGLRPETLQIVSHFPGRLCVGRLK